MRNVLNKTIPYTHMCYVWCVQCVHQGKDAGIILRCTHILHRTPIQDSKAQAERHRSFRLGDIFFSHIHTLPPSTHSLTWAHKPTTLASRPTATNPSNTTQMKWQKQEDTENSCIKWQKITRNRTIQISSGFRKFAHLAEISDTKRPYIHYIRMCSTPESIRIRHDMYNTLCFSYIFYAKHYSSL